MNELGSFYLIHLKELVGSSLAEKVQKQMIHGRPFIAHWVCVVVLLVSRDIWKISDSCCNLAFCGSKEI
jgi:hypothetical protein